jgi:hypothetical protein
MPQNLTTTPAGAALPALRRAAVATPRSAPVLQVSRMPAQLSLFGRLKPTPAGRPRTE